MLPDKLISLLIIGIILVVYVYRKKEKVNFLVILVLVSLLPLVSLLRPGSYESGDLSLNVFKTMALNHSLRDGIFPANWAGILNATYGYPLFNFTYPLPYYLSWIIHLFGFSYVDSLKLFIALTFICSGISMFFFLKSLLKPFYAFIGAIFYLFAPYHLVDMHFRTDIGEISAMVFVPLVFLWSTTLLQKYNPFHIVFLAFSLCGLILSHQAVSLTAVPFLIIYVLLFWYVQKRPITTLLSLMGAGILGVGLASFYMLPVLFELQYTVQSFGQKVSFPLFWEFFYSPWRYGFLFQGPKGELSFVIGYVHLALIIFSCYLVWKAHVKHPYKLLLIFNLCAFFLLFLLMQSFSEPLWYIIPLIKNFQFSYRLLSVVMFFTAVIATITTIYIPKKGVYLLLFAVIFSTYLNWANRQTLPQLNDAYFAAKLPYSTSEGEGLTPAAPKWVDPQNTWFKIPPKHHLEVVIGKATIKQISRNTIEHLYEVNAKVPTMLLENTLYFPGWEIYINTTPNDRNGFRKTDIHIVNEPGKKGLMHFVVPEGISQVKVVYGFTAPRVYGLVISFLSFGLLLFLAMIDHKKYSI